MRLSDLRNVIVNMIDAGISTIVEGPPGGGKSSFMVDTIDWLSERDGFEWGLSLLFLATQTITELQGYTFKGERWWDEDGNLVDAKDPRRKLMQPTAVTDPTLPLWMLSTAGKPIWAYRRGILVLEEYGQGESDTKRGTAQLLLKGELGPFKLPGFQTGDGWGVVGLTNSSGDRSGVTKNYDFIINRVAWITLTNDIVGTEAALVKRNVHPHLVAFAHQHPEVVLAKGVPEKQGPWMTPRSLEAMSKYLTQAMRGGKGKLPVDSVTQEACAALVGVEAAMAVFNFIRLEQDVPTIEEIVKDPTGAPLPQSLDARYLVCFSLAHRVDEKNAEKVLTYIDRLGKEFAVTFAKAACGRMPMLAMAPDFVEWAKGNSSLMALMQQFR